MTKKLREAIERVKRELRIAGTVTGTAAYFQFLEDMRAIIAYAERPRRKKRV